MQMLHCCEIAIRYLAHMRLAGLPGSLQPGKPASWLAWLAWFLFAANSSSWDHFSMGLGLSAFGFIVPQDLVSVRWFLAMATNSNSSKPSRHFLSSSHVLLAAALLAASTQLPQAAHAGSNGIGGATGAAGTAAGAGAAGLGGVGGAPGTGVTVGSDGGNGGIGGDGASGIGASASGGSGGTGANAGSGASTGAAGSAGTSGTLFNDIRAPRIISKSQRFCRHEEAAKEAAEKENAISTIGKIS